MKFGIFALAFAGLASIGAAEPVNPVEHYNEIAKRTACSAASWIKGLGSISIDVSKLSADFASINSDGSNINLSKFLTDSGNLITRIKLEASSIGACSPGINSSGVSSVQKVIVTVISKASALAKAAISKTKQVTSRALQDILRGQAYSIRSAVTSYGSSAKAKVPQLAASRTLVNNDVTSITKAINSVISAYP